VSFLYAQPSVWTDVDEAIRRLEEALTGGSWGSRQSSTPEAVQSAAPSGTPVQPVVQETRGGQQPFWVENPYTMYPRNDYITAVGTARNRREAEQNAFSSLAATFGQDIVSSYTSSTIYTEAITGRSVSFTDDTKILETIYTAAKLDSLIGAEIRNVWDNGQGIIFALACMDRRKTTEIYTQLILLNQFNINNLTGMTDAEKNTFDGYSRYKIASVIAALNRQYANIISVAGGSISLLNLSDTDSLELEASNILKNITITLNVKGDNANRVQHAFTRIVNNEGLRVQAGNSPYLLEVTLTLNDINIPNNRNSFCEYVITANFIENLTGAVLLSYNESNMVSDLSYDRAANRAINMVERLINEHFSVLFKEYIITVF
jgi:hypothetical protein